MTQPHIGIVTVLYNGAEVLPDFFSTLAEQTYTDFTLYVVDNASTDTALADARRLAADAPFKTVFLPQQSNIGVAAGNNAGIRAALNDGCEYVLLSNNDTILQPDTIQALYDGLIAMGADMAVPKIYYANTDKVIWCTSGSFAMKSFTTRQRGQREQDKGQYDSDTACDYAPTCFMLIKSEVFGAVGLMDEKYFVYYDDSDFVWRAVKYHGKKLAYIHKPVLWHKVSVSTGGNDSPFSMRYLHRNHVYFGMKHQKGLRKAWFAAYIAGDFVLRKMRKYNKEQLSLILRSYKEGLNLYRGK